MILRIMILTLLGSTHAHAHGGKTNAEGCHTEKKTGIYHCHNGAKPTPATVPTNPVNTPAQTPLATDTKPNSAGIMKLDYDGLNIIKH